MRDNMQYLSRLWAVLLCGLGMLSLGADWPQFWGPGRDGISKEKGLVQSFTDKGPPLVWTCSTAGTGYAGMAVVGGKVYTMGARDKNELVLALDDNGKEMWSAKIGPVFDFGTNVWTRGPNATPTVDGNLLFGLGSQGILVCVDISQKGKVVWSKDLPKELGAEVNPIGGGPKKFGWGFSWSPLVDGQQLICVPGGSGGMLAALDKQTGKVLWRSKEVKGQATYSSPIVAEIAGVRQYIQMTQTGVVGVSAKDGSLLWEYKRPIAYGDVVCATPLCEGNKVYITAWKGSSTLVEVTRAGNHERGESRGEEGSTIEQGSKTMVEPSSPRRPPVSPPAFKAKQVYEEREISNIHSGVVKVGKYVYGYQLDRGGWICQEFATGTRLWSTRRNRRALGMGSMVVAQGHLYCLSAKGEVAILEATPKKYTEKGRFKLPQTSKKRKLRGYTWTYPSLSDGKLYVRDQELIFCFNVKK